MVDFVNPGLLGTLAAFKKNYETPIVRARQPNARKEVMDLGKERSEELSSLTGIFMLRRTSEILAKYLPKKRISQRGCGVLTRQMSMSCSVSRVHYRNGRTRRCFKVRG